MKKWEYKITDNLKKDELNALGAQGWELVATVCGDNIYDYRLLFKRPKY